MLASASAISADTPPCSTLNGCPFVFLRKIRVERKMDIQTGSSSRRRRRGKEEWRKNLASLGGNRKATGDLGWGYFLKLETHGVYGSIQNSCLIGGVLALALAQALTLTLTLTLHRSPLLLDDYDHRIHHHSSLQNQDICFSRGEDDDNHALISEMIRVSSVHLLYKVGLLPSAGVRCNGRILCTPETKQRGSWPLSTPLLCHHWANPSSPPSILLYLHFR